MAKKSAATAATSCAGLQTCTPEDAHARHQAAGFDCISCHPCGSKYGFRVGYTFAGGTTIQPTDVYTPPTATSPATCTVACHYPLGSPAVPVTWNAAATEPLACVRCHDLPTLLGRFPDHPRLAVDPPPSRAQCLACHVLGDQHTTGKVALQGHPLAWMTTTDPGFHAASANRGLAACQGCHRQDLGGGLTGVACANCHRAGGTANDFAKCTACHGGQDNPTGAPPAAIWGYAGSPARGGGVADPMRVGAHTAHLTEGVLGNPAFGCEVCHVKPTAITAPGHIDEVATGADPLATVTFAGLAVNGSTSPAWSRSSGTCSNTYCHGATLGQGPGALNAPTWTGGASQAYCGSCHGVPPPPPHVAVTVTNNDHGVCNPCHSSTVDGAGNIIPASQGGTHLNGLLEGSGHDAAWMDRTSASFHAFSADRGIQNCASCHGADLAGGSVGVACAKCHKAGGAANDFTKCTACHGGQDDQSGAPPVAIWGRAGDPDRGGGTMDPVRVGAHTRHGTPSLAARFDCDACHVKPAGLLSVGHIDDPTPVAKVVFGGLAAGVPAGTVPVWDRATASCASTYCHGNYAGTYAYSVYDWGSDSYTTVYVGYAGKKATATWTGGPMTCASCHDNPPRIGNWHSSMHGSDATDRQCELCHPDATGSAAGGVSISDPARHVNGSVEVTPRWESRCFRCH